MMLIFQQALQSLLADRFRNLLVIISISCGVMSFIVLMAFGNSFYHQQIKSFSYYFSPNYLIGLGNTEKSWHGRAVGRPLYFSPEILEKLGQSHLIQAYSPIYRMYRPTVSFEGNTILGTEVLGVTSPFLTLNVSQLSPGSRNFNHNDRKQHQHVAIVGARLAENNRLHLHDTLFIKHLPFTIIGILEPNTLDTYAVNNASILIPDSVFRDLSAEMLQILICQPLPSQGMDKFSQQMRQFLSSQLHADPNDGAIYLPDSADRLLLYQAIFRAVQGFLVCGGALTLLVGALGIMNILYLSISERRKEIGVRLAIGATEQQILLQILLEGSMLAIFGLLLGLLMSVLLIQLLQSIALPDWIGWPQLTRQGVLWATTVTTSLTLLASYFPARKAAQLAPVAALYSKE